MKGQIEVKDLSLVYYKGGPEVLTDFNWSVVSLVEQAPVCIIFISVGNNTAPVTGDMIFDFCFLGRECKNSRHMLAQFDCFLICF